MNTSPVNNVNDCIACQAMKAAYAELVVLQNQIETDFKQAAKTGDLLPVKMLQRVIEAKTDDLRKLLFASKSVYKRISTMENFDSPLVEVLDLDKINLLALNSLGRAIDGWLSGAPLDEVALMNRITEQIARRRRGCDVGVKSSVAMEPEVLLLHRKGNNQTDLYGSDIAVTVSVPNLGFLKTALFQLKKCKTLACTLELKQLQDALVDTRIAPRAFVLAVDEDRHVMRIESVQHVAGRFSTNQKSKTFDCSVWSGLSIWLHAWLSCAIAPSSIEQDSTSIESMLRRHVVPKRPRTIWSVEAVQEVDDSHLPARAWMILEFKTEQRS